MRIALILTILVYGPSLFAWDCPQEYSASSDIGVHLEQASDVIYGQALSARIVRPTIKYSEPYVEVVFEIHTAFKGDYSGNITLKRILDPAFEPLSVADTFIVFLYGSNSIDSCSKIIKTYPDSVGIEWLESISNRQDISFTRDLREVLKYAGLLP